MITEAEQIGADIDWYFTDLEHVCFVTSGGGKLPQSVSMSADNLEELTVYLYNLPFVSDIVINPELKNNADKPYLETWVSMAKRGIFAYDKTAYNNFSDSMYHLLARPLKPLKYKILPESITQMLSNTTYLGGLIDCITIDLIK